MLKFHLQLFYKKYFQNLNPSDALKDNLFVEALNLAEKLSII